MPANWDAVRLALLSRGYHAVVFVELGCRDCGTWRGAVWLETAECSDQLPCPQCNQLHEYGIMAKGFARNLPPWERWSRALSRDAMRWLFGESEEAAQRTAVRRSRQSRERIRKNEWISRRAVAT